jgi:predicted metal-dependent phosphoesterase TrpH
VKIDLHSHSLPLSTCSHMTPKELVQRAKESGLDGICLTEHNKAWNPDEIRKLRDTFEFPVFRGMEVTSKDGDILVFGFHENIDEILTAAELRERAAGAYTVAAHPFRGFLVFGFPQLSLTPEHAADRPIFHAVDAIEAYNCKVTGQETEMAFNVASMLDLPCVAGSDAHKVADIGKLYTHFDNNISTEEELVAELFAGRFSIEPLHVGSHPERQEKNNG